MSIPLPQIALGVEIPNPTLSLPDSTGLVAAGWTVSGAGNAAYGITNNAWLPTINHGRALAVYRASVGTITLQSGPGPYGRACEGDGAKFSALILATSNAANATCSAKVQFLNSSGAQLGELQLSPTSFGLGTQSYTPVFVQSAGGSAPPSGSVAVRLQLQFTHTAGFTVVVAFACPGVWDSTNDGYKALTSYAGVGSRCMKAQRSFQRDYRGRAIFNDALVQADPFMMEIPWELIPLADYRILERAHNYYCGVPGCNPNAPYIPSGGHWPLLLQPGHPDLPQAGLYEFESFDLKQDLPYVAESGYYSGTIRLRERV